MSWQNTRAAGIRKQNGQERKEKYPLPVGFNGTPMVACPAGLIRIVQHLPRCIKPLWASLPLLHGDVVPVLGDADVGGTDDLAGANDLLDPVSAPAGYPRDGEDRGVHLLGDAEHAV